MGDKKEIAKAIVESEFMDTGVGFLALEVTAVAIGLGVWLNSWWIGGIVFIALMTMQFFRKTAIPMTVVFSICWMIAGWAVGHYLIHNTGAAVVLAIIALIISVGMHAWALEFTLDDSKPNKRKSAAAAAAKDQPSK